MTLRQLKRLIKSASNDATRPHLSGVHVTMAYVEATDGHRLVREAMDTPILKDGESILITREHIKTLSSVYNTKSMQDFELHFNRESDTKVLIQGFGLTLTLNVNEFKYPNCDQILAVKRNSPYRIALDARLLVSLCESMNDVSPSKPLACVIEVDLDDVSGKPFTVTCGESEAKAVLMPLRSVSNMADVNKSTLESLRGEA